MLQTQQLYDLPFTLNEKSALGQYWQMKPYDERQALALSQMFGLPDIVSRILAAKTMAFDEIPHYLDPKLRHALPDLTQIQDMQKAASLIADAVMQGKKLAVFGDYDVDGGTSSAILIRFMRMLGLTMAYHIPDRIAEGYGPNIQAFQNFQNQGIDLIITVDCGSTSHHVLKMAHDLGMNIIVIDHHLMDSHFPQALAIVNPNRPDDMSDLGSLTAAGVTFLVCIMVTRLLKEKGFLQKDPDLLSLLDLVALGTICDVAPLEGLNRSLVAQGLKVMAARNNKGIAALMDIAGVTETPSPYHCGFLLGPRINAGGRVGRADAGVQILTTEDDVQARTLAEELHRYNEERKAIEDHALQEAIEKVENLALYDRPVLIVAGEGWHSGVIGIVAARLKERYGKPSFVIALEGGIGKGSGRSIEGVDIGTSIRMAVEQGLLVAGGGHKMAAGLTIAQEKMAEFYDFMCDFLKDSVEKALANPVQWFDGYISVSGLTIDLFQKLEQLQPFGVANPTPILCVPHVKIAFSKIVGEKHMKIVFEDAAKNKVNAMAFRAVDNGIGALVQKDQQEFHIFGTIKRDTWRGNDAVQFMVDDIIAA